MKKALIAVTSHDQIGTTGKRTGWYLNEVTRIFYPLREAGFEVDFVSPKGGPAPMDQKSYDLKDELNLRFVEEGHLSALERTLSAEQVDPASYEVIFFAGGHGTMWDFPNARGLQSLAARIYEKGGIVSAVCHGPAALVNLKLSNGEYLVKGKTVAPFTNEEEIAVGLESVVPFLLEDELRRQGATIHASAKWSDRVVTSERLVTGQNPQSAHSVGRAIVELAKSLAL